MKEGLLPKRINSFPDKTYLLRAIERSVRNERKTKRKIRKRTDRQRRKERNAEKNETVFHPQTTCVRSNKRENENRRKLIRCMGRSVKPERKQPIVIRIRERMFPPPMRRDCKKERNFRSKVRSSTEQDVRRKKVEKRKIRLEIRTFQNQQSENRCHEITGAYRKICPLPFSLMNICPFDCHGSRFP